MSDYITDAGLGDEYDVVQAFSDGQPRSGPVPDDSGYEDDVYYDEPTEYDDSQMIDELVDSRVEAELAGLMEPNMAEQYWAEREARQAEEAQLEQERVAAEVRPQLDALLEQTGRKFGVVESARNGRLEAYANELLAKGQHAARVGGWPEADQAGLYTAQAATNAVEMAAEGLRVRAVTDRGLAIIEGRGSGPTPYGGTRH